MTDHIIEEAIHYLGKNPLLHMGMLEPIRRGHADIIYADRNAVLLRETKSSALMLSSSNPEIARVIVDSVEKPELFVAHQDYCVTILQAKFGYVECYDCIQAVYTKSDLLPESDKVIIRSLDEKYLPEIREHYHLADDPQYIGNLLREGSIFGAFIDGKLVGFIGIHAEGSLGLLEVYPEYRRQKIGIALESFLINHMLKNG